MCSYLSALGKLMQGSGFEEIIIESGVCASGSMNKVMNGKHYNRAIRVHVVMLEALERHLFRQFQQYTNSNDVIKNVKKDLKESMFIIKTSSLECSSSNENVTDLWMLYSQFREDVRQGRLGKSAQFWIQYMDKVWLLLRFLRASKTNSLSSHVQCLQELCPLFFSMDHQNYARYASAYLISLINLPQSHPGAEELLNNKGFSVSRSGIPASRTAVDLTIEQTINRHAKSRGGIIGFSRNMPAYHRWCITRHARARYLNATLELADMSSEDSCTHKEERPSRIKESERAVQKVHDAIKSFINPFDIDDKESLVCLSSGMKASDDVASDLLAVDQKGKEMHQEFVQKRLKDKEIPFHHPIKKASLKTFQSFEKSISIKSSKHKKVHIAAQRNIFGQLLMLTTQHDLDLQKVLSYPLSPIPWALATPDGLPVKTDKSILMHKLEDPSAITDVDRKTNEEQTVIIDGNALLHSLTSIPETFGQLAEKIFNLLPNTKSVHFVTDTYNHNSIKCPERSRRAVSQAKPLLMCGQSTKTPKDWRSFLSREENKTNFINFLLTSWQENKYAEYLSSRELFFVCADQCLLLTTHDGTTTDCSIVQSLCSSQEEADTRIILHCFYAAPTCQELVVHSPDTDVFLLLLYFTKDISTPVFLHTGIGIHRRVINMSTLNMIHDRSEIRALLGLHSFTGCDTTSAFLRRGKSKSLKIIKTKPHFKPVFEALGLSAEVDTKTMSDLEQFVCEMYGKPSYTDVNKLRFDMVRQRFRTGAGSVLSSNDGIDLSLLPPCRSTLHMHIKRANYQALVWKESTNAYPDLPSPEEHGWKINSNGDIDYNWCGGDIIPQDLVDILSTYEPESNDWDDTVDDILSDGIDSDEASDSEDSDVEDRLH